MRVVARSVVVGFLAVLSAVILGLTSTMTAAVTLVAASSVALVMGGTGRPDPEQTYLDNVSQYYIYPNTFCTAAASCTTQKVITPEEFWPIPGWGGLNAITFNQSTYEGLGILDTTLQSQLTQHPDQEVVIFGYSQSARITTLEMRKLADPAYTGIVPKPDQLEVVLIGNINRPNGGILARFPGLYIPILEVSFDGATPTDTGYKMTDIALQYDGLADFPLYPINLLADLNAVAGFWYIHGTYPDPTRGVTVPPYGFDTVAAYEAALANPDNRQSYGPNNTYITIPVENLPILQPLRDLGASTNTTAITEPIADLIQPTWTVLIETGYDRNIPYGQATHARLIPIINPITLTTDLVKAGVKGVQDAVADITGGTSPAPAAPLGTLNVSKLAAENTIDAPNPDKPAAEPKVTLTTPWKQLKELNNAADKPSQKTAIQAKPQRPKPLRDIGRELQRVADTITNAIQRPSGTPAKGPGDTAHNGDAAA